MVAGGSNHEVGKVLNALEALILLRYCCGCGGVQPSIPTALYIVAA